MAEKKEVTEFRKRVGEKKYKEIVDHARELKKAKKSPDEIAEALKARFPEIATSFDVSAGPVSIAALTG